MFDILCVGFWGILLMCWTVLGMLKGGYGLGMRLTLRWTCMDCLEGGGFPYNVVYSVASVLSRVAAFFVFLSFDSLGVLVVVR